METMDDLQERIARSTQKDLIHGMFIENSLTRLAEVKGAAAAEKARREILGGKKLVGFFRYPVADLLNIMKLSVVDPNNITHEFEEIGANAVRIFFDSPVGKTMVMLAGTNPHRLISSSPAGYRASVSFGERTYFKTSDAVARMEFRGELLGPSWQVGVFKEALQTACGINPGVTVENVRSAATDFDVTISW